MNKKETDLILQEGDKRGQWGHKHEIKKTAKQQIEKLIDGER